MPHPRLILLALFSLPVFAVTAHAAVADTLRVPAAADSAHRRAMPGVQDTVTVLPPIEVETGRREASPRSTATTVRMDRAQLQRYVPPTTADALITAPGVDLIRSSPWATRVSLRGYSGERTLLMVDGVRLNSGRGHGALSSLVGVERLFQVDVSPGAASAQYGSDAMGGVVNLVTHRNLLTPEPAAVLTLGLRGQDPGGNRSEYGRLSYTGPGLGAEIAGGLSRIEGLSTPDGMIPNSASHDEDLTGRVVAKLGLATVDFEQAHHAARDIGLAAFNTDAGGSGEFPLQGRDASRLELVARPSSGSQEWRVLGSDQTFRSEFNEQSVEGQVVRGRLVAIKTTSASDQLRTRQRSVQPTWRIGTLNTIQIGGEYRYEETSGPRDTRVMVQNMAGDVTSDTHTASETVPPASRQVWSGNVANAVTLNGLRMELGARYDWTRSRADSTPISATPVLDVTDRRLSVEGGFAYPVGAFEPYAHAGSGLRSPNLEDRYYNGEVHNGMHLFGNPDLVPETSMSYELGLRASGSRGSMRVSAYRSELDNYITLKYLGQLYMIARFQSANVRNARIEGIEFNGRTPVGGGALGVSATLPRGFDMDTGERLPDVGVPRVTVDLTQSVGALVPDGMLSLGVRWADAVPADPSTSEEASQALARPAFWVANVELGFHIVRTRATLAVRNLFNHSYREPMSFIEEPGRTFAFALQRDFALPLPGGPEASIP